jgi:hypothetical protein
MVANFREEISTMSGSEVLTVWTAAARFNPIESVRPISISVH